MALPADKYMSARIWFVQILLIGGLVLLGFRAVSVQILQGDALSQRAEKTYVRSLAFRGYRGLILDRNSHKLGASIDAKTLAADPVQVKNPRATAKILAKILSMNAKSLEKRLSTNKRFALIARDISPDQEQAVKKAGLAGIYFEKDFKRFYPNRELAAQVIGFTGKIDKGLEGIESKYDSVLAGRQKKIRIVRDGNGHILGMDKNLREQLRGNSLVLTLDKKIQFFAEQALEQAVEQHGAKSGMALVMEPATGEFLAIAHYPRFNLNRYEGCQKDVFRNRAVTDPFEPGSALKIFTAAAALENGIGSQEIFYCEKGKYKIGNSVIRDTHPREWLSVERIFQYSSNIGFAKISEKMGKDALYDSLVKFGFGNKTRMGCPGETPGIIPPVGKWGKRDVCAISFGQGVSVSAVQLLSGVSTIANEGKAMQPLIVKKILANTGENVQVFSPKCLGRAVSQETARKVARMMRMAVAPEGTGHRADIPGYQVCGKTGTAQKTLKGQKGYAQGLYTSVFAGFAPMNQPRLSVLVVVDEPKDKYYGGIVAAPAFKEIMLQSLNYLGVAPAKDESPKEMGQLADISVHSGGQTL